MIMKGRKAREADHDYKGKRWVEPSATLCGSVRKVERIIIR